MKNNREIPWPRIFAEGGAILLSILLAFWIDAWWDDRADDKQERALLIALSQDFQAARNEFETISAGHKKVLDSMVQILNWAEAGSVSEDDRADVDVRLSNVFYRPKFDPPMGAVDTILASGRLDLLSNTTLVTELTRWSSLVKDLNEHEDAAANHFYQTVYPYLSANLNIQDLDKDIPYPGGVPWPQQPANAYMLVPNRDFHNVIYVHWVLYWNVQTRLPKVDDALGRIMELTTAELGLR
jgi:hypothetical protein